MKTDKLILKFTWKCKNTRRAKATLKNKAGRLTRPYIKTYCTAIRQCGIGEKGR